MSEGRVERRLAAILAADVVGYSRLMGQDEAGTLARLRALRRDLIEPKVRNHKGRIVKTTGDGFLIEFTSVVEAVACAVAVQQGMTQHNDPVPRESRIEFRVGINLGDVIVEDDDIHGDGVNVAARLEALAEPGGICVSAAVHDQVQGRLEVGFEDTGEQSLKNIVRPVRVYRVATAMAALAPTPRSVEPIKVTPLTAPSRFSIAVLPFASLSGDPAHEYFADAITENLITDLSHLVKSFVISRTTALTYKGKPVDVKQIGADLNVNYVVEGSVRVSGDRVRINVQLIGTQNGAHIWADRFEVNCSNLDMAEDEVVGRLARSLHLELLEAVACQIEQESSVNPGADDLVMLGWARFFRPQSGANLQAAQKAFEQALTMDPGSVDARAGVAHVLGEYLVTGTSKSREEDMARSEQLLREGLERTRNDPRLLYSLGRLRRLQGRLTEAQINFEKVIAADRNHSGAILQVGITLLFLGQPQAALPHFERSLELNFRWQNVFFNYYWLGQCHLLMGRADEAVDLLTKGRAENPQHPGINLMLAAALGLSADMDGAKAVLAEVFRLAPRFNSFAGLNIAYVNWDASPAYVALRQKTLDVGLRQAGLPEE